MPRPATTAGDVERAVKGALKGGWPLGTFEVRVEGKVVRLLPCRPVEPQDDVEANPWDDDLPR